MKATAYNKRSRKRGFTLSEVIVASGVSIFVIMISSSLLLSMLKSEAKITNNYVMDTQTVRFVTQLSRDIQAAAEVELAKNHRFRVRIPRYGGVEETVEYKFRSADEEGRYYIRRILTDEEDQTHKSDPVENIIEYEIKYYDHAKAETSEPEDIRFVQLNVGMNRIANNQTHSRTMLTPLIMLRNKQVAN